MTSFGYTLSSEEHAPGELVRNPTAEEVGFEAEITNGDPQTSAGLDELAEQ